ncbi:hypothetical protein BW723_05445 [Polaribacter reichenbachii]|uniref:Adhesin domain-containing protein n=1 Tax=Polaribacter reichenbachii TaxID=996801 RepID=A0A1B8TUD8_9FLAO|nr:hypothetical protein [Polaribacter reichenbachii]APZ45774.1 hypothetical protein BW723_05445 [Polaribacter reichenbachii]AUC19636.1 hypothetical protein BTO17_13460 [Polaribacter reichenbachii]OBY63210.1 hypothetical protein LPB301_10265 [Polaribacter reichenbachii]
MKPYIFSIILFFSITFSFAQTKEVLLKKSFKVDENTILNLDLDNTDVHLIASKDDKIHFNYQITFYNYSQRKIDDILDESVIKTSKKQNQLFLKAKNSKYLGINLRFKPNIDFTNFKNPINNVYKEYLKNYYKKIRDRKYVQKTKDSLLKEIDFSIGSDYENYIKKDIDNFPQKTPLKTDKKIEKKFIIQVPKYVQLRIKSIESNINCDYDINTEFKLESFKGIFKFKNLSGKLNQIISSNGILETYSIANGKTDFRDMRKVMIGATSNSKIVTETSKIQIGEIGKNVSIKDFNSKLYLYNFSENFTKFNLIGDYSELNFYKIKENNFSMDVSGFNTTLNMNGVKTTFGISKEEKMTKILQKKRKENIPFLGNIEVELKHGIINLK